jgi:hypothetical protein
MCGFRLWLCSHFSSGGNVGNVPDGEAASSVVLFSIIFPNFYGVMAGKGVESTLRMD